MPAFASFVLVSRSQRSAVNCCCCCCCYLLNKIFVLPRTNTLSLALSLTLSCAHTEAYIGCLPTHSLHVSLLFRLCIRWLSLRLPQQQRRWRRRRRCAVPTATKTTTRTSALLPATTCMCMSLGSAAASLPLCRCCGQSQSLAPIGDYALSLLIWVVFFVFCKRVSCRYSASHCRTVSLVQFSREASKTCFLLKPTTPTNPNPDRAKPDQDNTDLGVEPQFGFATRFKCFLSLPSAVRQVRFVCF